MRDECRVDLLPALLLLERLEEDDVLGQPQHHQHHQLGLGGALPAQGVQLLQVENTSTILELVCIFNQFNLLIPVKHGQNAAVTVLNS